MSLVAMARCGNCQTRFRVPAELLGCPQRCGHCGAVGPVEADDSDAPVAPAPASPGPYTPRNLGQPPTHGRYRTADFRALHAMGRHSRTGVLVSVLVASVVIIASVIFGVVVIDADQTPAGAPDADVQVSAAAEP